MTRETSTARRVAILVVDDRADSRLALRAILSRPDYRVVEAASAAEALRRLLEDEFAVLLLDVMMPDMNGIDLAEIVRGRERTATVPILFLTAETDGMDLVTRAYRVGAVDYLVKPLVPDVVRAKVAVFVELFRQRKRIEEQARLLVDAERKDAELKILALRLATERRYRSLAEAIPHIVWTAQPDGRVDYFNRQWFAYTAISTEEAAGSWDVALHPDDRAACAAGWQRSLASGVTFQAECRVRRADGAFRWHLCLVVPEHESALGVARWIGTLTDIDDRKRAEGEREILYRKAVEAIGARDEFLSIATHELRTPVTSLHLQVEGLLRPPRAGLRSPDQLMAKLTVALRQINRLSWLIDELLDVARIRSGTLELQRDQADLAVVVREIAARFADEAARKGTTILVHGDAVVEGSWDRQRVEQIVTNLVANALKFGPGKPIEISVRARGPLGEITVVDHGIGIAPDALERIFQRFERAVSRSSYGGLGLGLYIARQIAEAHGGTIRASSGLEEGTTFTVELPRQPASAVGDAASPGDASGEPSTSCTALANRRDRAA